MQYAKTVIIAFTLGLSSAWLAQQLPWSISWLFDAAGVSLTVGQALGVSGAAIAGLGYAVGSTLR